MFAFNVTKNPALRSRADAMVRATIARLAGDSLQPHGKVGTYTADDITRYRRDAWNSAKQGPKGKMYADAERAAGGDRWAAQMSVLRAQGMRVDAATRVLRGDSAQGFHVAGDLREKDPTLYEQEFQRLNYSRVLSIQPGAMGASVFCFEREYQYGTARIGRGGGDPPVADSAIQEQETPYQYVYAAYEDNWFDRQAGSFSGRDTVAGGRRAALRAVEQTINTIAFEGSVNHGMYGLYNHPYVLRAVGSSIIDGTTSGVDMAQRILTSYFSAQSVNESAELASDIYISSRLFRTITKTPFSSTEPKSVAAYVIETLRTRGIEARFVEIREFKGAGTNELGLGSTYDGIFVRGSGPSAVQMRVSLPPTELPPYQASAFENLTVVIACVTGAVVIDGWSNAFNFHATS